GSIRLTIGRGCVIEQSWQSLRVADALSDLALNSQALKVGGRFLKDERHDGTCYGHGHWCSRRRVGTEGVSQTFANDFSTAILQQVGRRLNFDEPNAKHMCLSF